MADLFTYIKRLTNKQPIDESKEEFEKGYSKYMINRFFSCEKSFVMLAKEMNRDGITNEMHFDFMDTIIPKSNKFIRYNLKKSKVDKEIKYIADFYQCSLQHAKQYRKLISKEDMKKIKDFFEKRGKK